MHIGINCLILKPGEYSGVHVAVRGLVNAVVAHAADDDYFTLYIQRQAPAGLPPESGKVRHLKPFWPVGWRAGRITWEQFRLFSQVYKDEVDLLHCPAYVMPRMTMKPVVVSVHDLFALRAPRFCTRANRSHFSRLLPVTLERAQRIIVPSDYVRREVNAWNEARAAPLPGLEKRIRVIPWGVDERFRPVTDRRRRAEVAARHGLPEKFVLFAGRIEPKKNVPSVIRSFFAAKVSQRLPHGLVLVGPRGWGEAKEVRVMIREHNLESQIVTPGFVPAADLPVIYSLASLLLFPSYAEGFGLPVLEAMACGTPVVCGDVPALREVGGEAVRLVSPDDLPGLRLALEETLTASGEAAARSEKGLARAREFSWEKHARATLALYQEVILEDRNRND